MYLESDKRLNVQSQLDVQPLVALEIHVLLAAPLVRAFSPRSRRGLSVDSTFRRRSASLAPLPPTRLSEACGSPRKTWSVPVPVSLPAPRLSVRLRLRERGP